MSRARQANAARVSARSAFLERFALAVTATVLTLALLELVARTQTPSCGAWQMWAKSDDPVLGVELNRNLHLDFDGLVFSIPSTSVDLSDQGLRSPHVAETKPTGVRRLVCLGDSVTFGWGVESGETFCARLASLLGPEWEPINLGVPGYNLEQSVRRYELRGLEFAADAAVLVLNSNDFDRPLGADAADEPSWWFRHSALVRWTALRLRRHAAMGESPVPTAGATTTDSGRAALTRLAALCRPLRTELAVALTFPADQALMSTLSQLRVAVVHAPDLLRRPERIIAGDGHPNALGHGELAGRFADALMPAPDAASAPTAGPNRSPR